MSKSSTRTFIHSLHTLVTVGPWDLDIAWAMSPHGYDEVKWAEGQAILAELISCDLPPHATVRAAARWYQAATLAARHALAGQPRLLTKLGVEEG